MSVPVDGVIAIAMSPWPGVAAGLAVVVVAVARAIGARRSGGARRGPTGKPVRPVHPVLPMRAGRAGTPIAVVRRQAGHRPRSFDTALADYLRAEMPAWLERRPTDHLRAVYAAQDRLRRDGRIVWACLVQANALLFKPGPSDSPASVVWSDDPYYDEHPEELSLIGSELYAVKGTGQADPGLAEFSRMLANEMDRANGLQVPESLTEGRFVYHSSIMCVRKHLPHGHVSGHLFPVWTDPEPTGLVLLVPAAFWPAELLGRWGPGR